MPYKAKADPWIKVETEHHFAEGGGEEECRCGTSWWSFPLLCLRRWKQRGTNHGQKWQIDEEEKEARWAANREMLKLKDERQTIYGSASVTDIVPQGGAADDRRSDYVVVKRHRSCGCFKSFPDGV